jgi:proteasome accessory factor A
VTEQAIRPFLMGAETEYAVSGRKGNGSISHDLIYHYLRQALCAQRRWMADHHGYCGIYLEHGGRFYLDYGSHPEHATAECFTPRQVACHDKAGEYLLALARSEAEKAHGVRISIVKNNLDPVEPDSTSYGTHESYTCWVESDTAAEALLPHLASRVLYAGSGGLSGWREGKGFDLSQRARHLNEAVGCDTTCNRPIFGTRVRKESDRSVTAGWTRVHLISKDSQRAPFGIYLTHATTGLLIEMLNRGYVVGRGLQLDDPVEALHTLAADPGLKARVALADGRTLTALEIQSAYLEECERALQGGNLPEWASETIGYWRATLTALERNPLSLADRLDTYCKLLIFDRELARAGRTWEELRDTLALLRDLRSEHSDDVVKAVLTGQSDNLDDEDRGNLPTALAMLGAERDRKREALHFALRMQMIDINYHELGGLYDRLRSAGRMTDVILTPADVEAASRTPPPGGRAAARGACIHAHTECDWRAEWQYVWQVSTGRCFDLRDPFSGESREVKLILPTEEFEPAYVDVLDQLIYPPQPEPAPPTPESMPVTDNIPF